MIEVNNIDLKISRIKSGYRQYEVAAKLRIHPCQLSEIESGRRKPSDAMLKRILTIINYSKNTIQVDGGKFAGLL